MVTATSEGLGVIEAASTYPLPLFKRLTGLSDHALRQARRRGLKVRRSGRRRYVCGADFQQFLTGNGA